MSYKIIQSNNIIINAISTIYFPKITETEYKIDYIEYVADYIQCQGCPNIITNITDNVYCLDCHYHYHKHLFDGVKYDIENREIQIRELKRLLSLNLEPEPEPILLCCNNMTSGYCLDGLCHYHYHKHLFIFNIKYDIENKTIQQRLISYTFPPNNLLIEPRRSLPPRPINPPSENIKDKPRYYCLPCNQWCLKQSKSRHIKTKKHLKNQINTLTH